MQTNHRGIGHTYIRYIKPCSWWRQRVEQKALFNVDEDRFVGQYGLCYYYTPDWPYSFSRDFAFENYKDNQEQYLWGNYMNVKLFCRLSTAWGNDDSEFLEYNSKAYEEYKEYAQRS